MSTINFDKIKTCTQCPFGVTTDLSIDDLCTHCYLTGTTCDHCDFPLNKERMWNCPLSHPTPDQIKQAEYLLNLRSELLNIQRRTFFGKTKLIRKRNKSKAKKLIEKNKDKSSILFGFFYEVFRKLL